MSGFLSYVTALPIIKYFCRRAGPLSQRRVECDPILIQIDPSQKAGYAFEALKLPTILSQWP